VSDERWSALMNNPNGRLTREEMADGWHWCADWDDLLVGPGMMEMDCCGCGVEKSKHVSPMGANA
jgi:hypothetical protein